MRTINSQLKGCLSGYPARKRGLKPLAFLQSFSDDSIASSGDQRLFMAGYLALYQVWERFSNDWDAVLIEEPSIKYLRMVEAQNLRGEFRYWTEEQRNKKLMRFADVINSYNLTSFEFSVNTKAYREYVRPHAPRGMSDPRFAANFHVVSGLARYFKDVKDDIKIQFIFDSQDGIDSDVHLFFEYMCDSLENDAKGRINGVPVFLDDKEALPLQAADMIAWFVRRSHQMGKSSLPIQLDFVISDYHISSEIPDSILQKWGDEFSRSPILKSLQGKSEWKKFRKEVADLTSAGILPPIGNNFQYIVNDFRKRFSTFISGK